MMCLLAVRFLTADFTMWIGGTLMVIICSDVMAYFTGRILGGDRPFPDISAGKTSSGYWGGLIAGTVIGFLWFMVSVDFFDAFILSFVVCIAGQGGDLFESYFKRLANVKDSGNILPGHGGFLDRFDAFFAGIIVTFLYILCYGDRNNELFISIFG
jgi:phosphatidate cytidylyltransferase